MRVCGAAVVVTFEPADGVRLAAVWDGSRWATVHVLDGGTYGPVVERWDMANNATQTPGIPCTPEAFAALVEYRVLHTPGAAGLARLAADYLAPLERWPEGRTVSRSGVPEFSRN